jgi:hypothetical protein
MQEQDLVTLSILYSSGPEQLTYQDVKTQEIL